MNQNQKAEADGSQALGIGGVTDSSSCASGVQLPSLGPQRDVGQRSACAGLSGEESHGPEAAPSFYGVA